MDLPHRRMFDLRDDGLDEIPILGWQSYSWARPDLPLHRHRRCLEIHYLERGDQVFQVGLKIYHLRGGDLFFTPPNEPHSSGGYPCGPGVLYCLMVRVPNRGQGLLGLSSQESRQLMDRFLQLSDCHFKAKRGIKPLFDRLFRLHDRPSTFLRQACMRAAVLQLLLTVLDSAESCSLSETSERIAAIVRLIRERPESRFRLGELAGKAHLSLPRFKGVFKAETGLSPWQFIIQTRIEAAQKRLRGEETPITDIAMDLGFPSSQYFATVFKRVTRMTPGECRRGKSVYQPSTRHDDGQG
jgi:AraC-like DNA-binding protein